MKKIIFIFLGLTILTLFSCGRKNSNGTASTKKRPKTGVNFVESNTLTTILDQAAAQNKLVFVDVYTTWCAPCKVMDEYVFQDKDLKKFMDQNFVSYKVDAEKGNGQTLALIYSVAAYPTLLLLDKEGKVISRNDGGLSLSEFRDFANGALAAAPR